MDQVTLDKLINEISNISQPFSIDRAICLASGSLKLKIEYNPNTQAILLNGAIYKPASLTAGYPIKTCVEAINNLWQWLLSQNSDTIEMVENRVQVIKTNILTNNHLPCNQVQPKKHYTWVGFPGWVEILNVLNGVRLSNYAINAILTHRRTSGDF